MNPVSRCPLLLALLALLPAICPAAEQRKLPAQILAGTGVYADQTIAGDPLAITVADDLSMTVSRNESGTYVNQYYSTYDSYIMLVDAGGNPTSASRTAGGFTALSNSSSANQIVTTVSCADNVHITQTIDYTPGATLFKHTWTIVNNGTTYYSTVDFRYGGDSLFHGDDAASGAYDAATGMVYCFNPSTSGFMGMYADPTTPAAHYYEDGYSIVDKQLEDAYLYPALPDTVEPSYIDNGMGLQWLGKGTLVPAGTMTFIAYEKWDAGSLVQVTPPATISTAVGRSVTAHFTVDNLSVSADTYNLIATATPGLTITSVPSTVLVSAGSSAGVDVAASVSASAANSTESISLTATSSSNATIANQNNVQVAVAALTTTTTTTLTAPTLPISTGRAVVYTPVCASTTEGIASLLAAFTAHGPDEAAAYAWDATLQRYALLPSRPTGGLLPETGFFVASRVPLSIDFSGTLSTLPYTVTLQPGWNLIGMPPLDDGGVALTTHAFPGDFELLDGGGALITTIAQFVDTIGTVGSGSLATTEPYWYDGHAYQQKPAMESGTAYWIKNNAAQAVTLRRTLTPVTLSIASHPGVAAGLHAGGKSASGAIDRGQPPPVPSSSAQTSEGSGCGRAAGVAGLVGLSLLTLRRRRSDGT